MNKNTILLIIAGCLIIAGLGKLDLSNLWVVPNRPSVDVMELPKPTDANVLQQSQDVLAIVKAQMDKNEAKRLRDLYLDMQQLIRLDGDDEVIKNTEDILQANSLAGPMLKLDLKGKYPDLAKECKEVVVSAIGDENIQLSPELRTKAMEGFGALAWAFNEGSK